MPNALYLITHPFARRCSAIILAGTALTCTLAASAQDPAPTSEAGGAYSYIASAEYFPIAQVPESIQEIAREAKPGTVLKKARLSWKTDEGLYIILGQYYGEQWRFRVTPSGRLISVSRDS